MNDEQDEGKSAFAITIGDIQQESIRLIRRRLNDEELETAIDQIDWGLSTGLDVVFKAAIDEAVEINRQLTGS